MTDLRSLSLEELTELILKLNEKKFRAGQIYDWVHKKLVQSYDEMNNIPKSLKEKLEKEVSFQPMKEVERYVSKLDGTTKFLFELHDGNIIETVLMKYHHGYTICISSQVGCAMGCAFCASTRGGKVRSLTAGEIIGQVFGKENVYRTGGDEFAVLLKHNDLLEYYRLEHVFLSRLEEPCGNITVSAAIGFAVYDKSIDECYESVYKRADENMYKCKMEMKTRGETSRVHI